MRPLTTIPEQFNDKECSIFPTTLQPAFYDNEFDNNFNDALCPEFILGGNTPEPQQLAVTIPDVTPSTDTFNPSPHGINQQFTFNNNTHNNSVDKVNIPPPFSQNLTTHQQGPPFPLNPTKEQGESYYSHHHPFMCNDYNCNVQDCNNDNIHDMNQTQYTQITSPVSSQYDNCNSSQSQSSQSSSGGVSTIGQEFGDLNIQSRLHYDLHQENTVPDNSAFPVSADAVEDAARIQLNDYTSNSTSSGSVYSSPSNCRKRSCPDDYINDNPTFSSYPSSGSSSSAPYTQFYVCLMNLM